MLTLSFRTPASITVSANLSPTAPLTKVKVYKNSACPRVALRLGANHSSRTLFLLEEILVVFEFLATVASF